MNCPHCGKPIFDKRPSADNAIEHYYRARAQGVRHLSLTKVAEKYGYSPGYLRKIKVAYDRAGKWGAKHKKALQ